MVLDQTSKKPDVSVTILFTTLAFYMSIAILSWRAIVIIPVSFEWVFYSCCDDFHLLTFKWLLANNSTKKHTLGGRNWIIWGSGIIILWEWGQNFSSIMSKIGFDVKCCLTSNHTMVTFYEIQMSWKQCVHAVYFRNISLGGGGRVGRSQHLISSNLRASTLLPV